MFRRFLNRRKGCGRRHCRGRNGGPRLSDFAQGANVIVASNSDHKTLEMGLFAGIKVHVIKNRPSDANMVIAIGDSRYIIAKEAAEKISVR